MSAIINGTGLGDHKRTDKEDSHAEADRGVHGHLLRPLTDVDSPIQNGDLGVDENATTTHEDSYKNPSHRRKLVHTAYTLAAYFALGLMVSQTGVAFLDLITIVDSDIELGSLIFTLGALGYMTGSMIGGVLFDKFDHDAIFSTCTFSAGLLTIAVPWCPFLPLMVAVVFVRSLFTGAMDSGGTVILLSIWERSANPYTQALHFMFAVGGVCAPVITEPFLLSIDKTSNQSEADGFDVQHTQTVTPNQQMTSLMTVLTPSRFPGNISRYDSSISSEEQISRVFIPFIIVGLYTILTSIPFLLKFVQRNHKMVSSERTLEDPVTGQNLSEQECTQRSRVPKFYYLLFGVYCFTYGCTEEVYAAFLMPFIVEHLGWSKSKGAGANSVYWGSFAGGRFLGIFVAKMLSARNMILTDFAFIILGLLGLLVAAERSDVAIWITNAVVGAGMASIFASTVTWLDQTVTPVTGKLAGYLVVTISIGTMTNTAILGFLFEEYTPMWFLYLTLGNTSVGLGIFVLMNVMNRNRKTKPTIGS